MNIVKKGFRNIRSSFNKKPCSNSCLPDKQVPAQAPLMLNIGSGDWECDGWINLDYPSEWYAKHQSGHKIIPYDIRSDNIPFKDNSADCVYCSHVIEHIEDVHVSRLFGEVKRILRRGYLE